MYYALQLLGQVKEEKVKIEKEEINPIVTTKRYNNQF